MNSRLNCISNRIYTFGKKVLHFGVSNVRVLMRVAVVSALITSLLMVSFIVPDGAGAAALTSIKSDIKREQKKSAMSGSDDIGSIAAVAKVDSLLGIAGNILSSGSIADIVTKKSRFQFDRIEVTPGNVTILQGDNTDFVATAYNGEQPVGGVEFAWTISEATGNNPVRRLTNGRLRAVKAGNFIVRASAEGRYGETEVTVNANEGYGIRQLLSKQDSDLTDAQRQQIAKWRATGVLTSREISSKNIYSIASERSLAAADQQKRDAVIRRGLEQKNTQQTPNPTDPSSTPLPESAASTNPKPKTRHRGGPSAADDSESVPNAKAPAPSRRTYSMDPLGWDSSNWATADDPANFVGRPLDAAPEVGAGNGNFTMSTPAVSLAGRGIDINLNLVYNSRLWNKAGSEMLYDADAGFPAPGWNLGFGRMYYLGSTGGCMLADSDGTRHSFGGSHSIYSYGGYYQDVFTGHTSDGSFTDYTCAYSISGGTTSFYASARLANGTTIIYSSPTTGHDQAFPTVIQDAQGNYININYVSNIGPAISTITDTLGRTIKFNYDSSTRLVSITGPGYNSTTRTYVRLHYASHTLSYAFSGLTTSIANGTPDLIDSIYYPDTNNGYWFGDSDSYSSYGMIAKVISQRGMSSTGTNGTGSNGTEGTVTAGTMNRQEVYNYTMVSDSSLTDAPEYTTHTETWDGMDNAAATPCFGSSTTAAVTCYSVTHPTGLEVVTITRPDGSVNTQTSSVDPGVYDDGEWVQNEVSPTTSTTYPDKTKTYFASGDYGSPRPTKIEHTDEKNQMSKVEFTYGSYFNQMTVQKDYDYSSTLYREHHYSYENGTSYTGAGTHVLSLLKSAEDYDGSSNRLTRTEYNYDASTLVAATSVVQHEYEYDPYTEYTQDGSCATLEPSGYDCSYEGQMVWVGDLETSCYCTSYNQISAYSDNTAYRGNLTSITSYADGNGATGGITHDFTYDITGNQITATTDCCQQISSSYSTATQFSKPDSITKGSSSTSSPYRMAQSGTYDFNTGVVATAIDFNGRTTTIGYDAVARPTLITLASGGKKTVTYNDSSLNRNELVQLSSGEGSGTVSNSTVYLNGRGQTNKSSYQAGSSNYNATQIKYDVMGRQWEVSRPYDTDRHRVTGRCLLMTICHGQSNKRRLTGARGRGLTIRGRLQALPLLM